MKIYQLKLWFLLQIVQKKEIIRITKFQKKNDVFDFLDVFYYIFWIGVLGQGKKGILQRTQPFDYSPLVFSSPCSPSSRYISYNVAWGQLILPLRDTPSALVIEIMLLVIWRI